MGKLSKGARTVGHTTETREKQTNLMSFFGKTPPTQQRTQSMFTTVGGNSATTKLTPNHREAASSSLPKTPSSGRIPSPSTDTDDIIPPTPESDKTVKPRVHKRSFLNANPVPVKDNMRTILKAKKKLTSKKAVSSSKDTDRPAPNYSIGGANENVEQVSELQMKCALANSGLLPVVTGRVDARPSGEKRQSKRGLTPDAKRRSVDGRKQLLTNTSRRKLELNGARMGARDFHDEATEICETESEIPEFSLTKLNHNILTNEKSGVTKPNGRKNTGSFLKPKRPVSVPNDFDDIGDIMDELKKVKNGIDDSEKSKSSTTCKSGKLQNSQSSETSSGSGSFDDLLLDDILQEIRGSTEVVKQHNYDRKLDNKYKAKTTPKSKKNAQSTLTSKSDVCESFILLDSGDEVEIKVNGDVPELLSTEMNVEDKCKVRILDERKTTEIKMADEPNIDQSKMAVDLECSGFGMDESWMEDLDLENVVSEELVTQRLCKDLSALSPFKEKKPPTAIMTERREKAVCQQYNRHVVLSVENTGMEVKLKIRSFPDENERVCLLRDSWTESIIRQGDVVNILSPRLESDVLIVDEVDGQIVVNPDYLVSGTTVVSSLFCMRKSVLNAKFKGSDRKNVHMLYGNIIHSIFQKVLQEKCSDTESVRRIADGFVEERKFLSEMYELQLTEKILREEISKYIPFIVKWTQKYVKRSGGFTFGEKVEKADKEISVLAVKDIEENVWCPRFGIKGKIDVTVEIEGSQHFTSSLTQIKSKREKKILPLELKTGKTSFSVEHKGQVMLYSMMLADRRVDPECGLLLYLKDASMQRIPAQMKDRKGLIQLRNELTHHLANPLDQDNEMTSLPAPINNQRMCSGCSQLVNCSIYQRHVDSTPLRPGHAMETLVPNALAHLSESHWRFFKRWCTMVELEAKAAMKKDLKKNIWCQSPEIRAKHGSGICDLSLVGKVLKQEGEVWLHTFKKTNGITIQPVFNRGESCIVSSQDGRLLALAIAFVDCLETDRITIIIDRDLSANPELMGCVYTLDKGDIFSSAYNFSTLAKLMEDDPMSAKLRELVVDHRVPEFIHTLSKATFVQVKSLFKKLNKPQKTAVLKVLMSRDYVLIKGYPGTGKTSTIVTLVRMLTALGQTVLLTSYTHSAVDNILIKLKEKNVDFVRIGREERVHPQIKPYSAEVLTRHITDVEKLEEFYASKSVVAMTCYGVNHPICSRRMFDVCIVDEASQILLPACLGPLFCAKKFVLVGDPQQLPPVIQSKEAVALGMSDSLFVLLDSNKATYELNVQYRMNRRIMSLCNSLVYNQALQCASDTIADSTLVFSPPDALEKLSPEAAWTRSVLAPKRGVVFLDTSDVTVAAEQEPTRNAMEAELARQLVEVLMDAGVSSDDIGLIAPYRKQVELLKSVIGDQGVEVNTVDQYQGRDKSVILITFTRCRTKDDSDPDDILQDLRRLNVAITRAKHKLVLIGSLRVLRAYTPLRRLAEILTDDQIIKCPNRTTSKV